MGGNGSHAQGSNGRVYFASHNLACENGVPLDFFRRVIAFLFYWKPLFQTFSKSSLFTSLEAQWSPTFEFQEVTRDHRVIFSIIKS